MAYFGMIHVDVYVESGLTIKINTNDVVNLYMYIQMFLHVLKVKIK